MYDSTNYDSFEHAADWLNEAKKQIEPNNAVFMLVGSKIDKDHLKEVPTEQAQQFAEYHNILFMETSSKTGFNVEKTFTEIALKIYEQLEEGKFRIQDGWDGIKSGYMRSAVAPPNRAPNLSLVEGSNNTNEDDSKKKCC